jgi:hypothetical protein
MKNKDLQRPKTNTKLNTTTPNEFKMLSTRNKDTMNA